VDGRDERGEQVTALATASASSAAEPGTLAFLVVFGMAVILVFLFRSMSKHLRKVNAQPRQDQPDSKDEPARTGKPPGD
jgi:hypothetical protein